MEERAVVVICLEQFHNARGDNCRMLGRRAAKQYRNLFVAHHASKIAGAKLRSDLANPRGHQAWTLDCFDGNHDDRSVAAGRDCFGRELIEYRVDRLKPAATFDFIRSMGCWVV